MDKTTEELLQGELIIVMDAFRVACRALSKLNGESSDSLEAKIILLVAEKHMREHDSE